MDINCACFALESPSSGTTKAVSLFLTSTACSVGYGPHPVRMEAEATAAKRMVKWNLFMLIFLLEKIEDSSDQPADAEPGRDVGYSIDGFEPDEIKHPGGKRAVDLLG